MKTIDQQLPDVKPPNRLIPMMLGIEPVLTGVRVTARDEQGRVLWGYVASSDNRYQTVCIYDLLQEIIQRELKGKA